VFRTGVRAKSPVLENSLFILGERVPPTVVPGPVRVLRRGATFAVIKSQSTDGRRGRRDDKIAYYKENLANLTYGWEGWLCTRNDLLRTAKFAFENSFIPVNVVTVYYNRVRGNT